MKIELEQEDTHLVLCAMWSTVVTTQALRFLLFAHFPITHIQLNTNHIQK